MSAHSIHMMTIGAPSPALCHYALLHGFTGLSSDWEPCWPAALPAIALDLPGHGRSADPPTTFAAGLNRILIALPASIHHLVGYSLGGRIALALIATAPQRFHSATIIAAHPGLHDMTSRIQRGAAERYWIDCLQQRGIDAFVFEWERQPLFASQMNLPPAMIAHQRQRRLQQRAVGLARCLTCFGLAQMPDTWAAMIAFRGRIRWITGDADDKFNDIAARVITLRPTTTWHRLLQCGHNPLLEAPDQLRQLFMRPW